MPHRRAPLTYHNPEDSFIPWLKDTFLGKDFADPRQVALNYQDWSEKQRDVIIRTLPTIQKKREIQVTIPATIAFIKPREIRLKNGTRIFKGKSGRIFIQKKNGQFAKQKAYSRYIKRIK